MINNFLIFFNTFISFSFIIYTISIIKKHKIIFIYPITNILLVLTNGIGIPFVKYANEDLLLFYSEEVSTVACLVNFIFIILCTIIQIFIYAPNHLNSNKSNINISLKSKKNKKPTLFFWVVLIIPVVGFIYFFFASGGISYLGLILTPSASKYEYYANRISVGEEISGLPGAVLAFILTTTINPALMAVIFYLDRSREKTGNFVAKTFYWLTIVYLSVSSALISLVFARRFMIIFSLAFPLIIFMFRRIKDDIIDMKFIVNFISKNVLVFFVGLLVILSLPSFVFSIVGQESFIDSFISLLERSIVVPAGTNNYYYDIFPNRLPYRGLEKIGKMGTPGSDDVTFQDIGILSVGRPLTANASFITVSYSAAGFLGVICITLIYSFICIFHDSFLLGKVNGQLKTLVILTNLYGIIMLGSVPLQTAISTFGFCTSTLLIYLCVGRNKY